MEGTKPKGCVKNKDLCVRKTECAGWCRGKGQISRGEVLMETSTLGILRQMLSILGMLRY